MGQGGGGSGENRKYFSGSSEQTSLAPLPLPYPIPPPLGVDQPVAIRIYALRKAVSCHPLILSGVISGLLGLLDPPAAEKQLRWGTEAGGR